MNKIKIVLFSVSALVATPWADDKIEFSGEHRAYFSVPATKSHDDFSGNIKVPRLENDLQLSADHSLVSLHAGLRVTSRLIQSGNEQTIAFRPLDSYLSLGLDKIETNLGFQTFSWGSADKFNPEDNLNPRDYTLGPDAEKLPLFAASVKAYPIDRLSVEAVYAPFDQEDLFPFNISDYIPDMVFSRSHIQSISITQKGLSVVQDVVSGKRDITFNHPAFDLSSSLAGARLKFMGGSLDVGASYLYDLDSYFTPVIKLEEYSLIDGSTTISPPLTIEQVAATGKSQAFGLKSLTLNRQRIHRIGMDAKIVVDRFGIWGEACLSIREKNTDYTYESRGDQFNWTLGLDFQYGSSDEHYMNIQQIGRYINDYYSDFSSRYPGMLPTAADISDEKSMQEYYYRMFTNRFGFESEGLFAGIAIRNELSFLDGNLKPVVEGVYIYPFHYDEGLGKRYGDITGNVRIDWKVVDAAVISCGAEGYYSIFKKHGSETISNVDENRIGFYFPDSRIFVNGTFNWSK